MSALTYLPPDVIEDILPFLPAKSLGRFKSVSKRWYSLISSPEFIKTHVRNYTKNNPNPNPAHLVLIPGWGDSIYSLDIKQLNTQPAPETLTAKRLNIHESWLNVLGSCNGLLLVYHNHLDLCLVNATTGKTLKVPDGMYMDTYGFGYDSSTDDYKIISISEMYIHDSAPDTKSVQVYSLRKKSWNMLPNFPYQPHIAYGRSPGLLLNNNLHWIVQGRRSEMTIAAFSLSHEKFHEIEVPDSFLFSQIFALGGKLVAPVVCNGGPCPEFRCELWVMEEYDVCKSWTKRYIFESNSVLDYLFFAQISNRDILLGHNLEGEIIMYNMDEKRCTSVTIEGCEEGFEVHGMYVESLESLERFG
ncbi:F-box/kelch-repeat protein At3g06240-like [Rutidosis leptorrhynchoides]|uniref:F-box/kelch-repeat protein At3g06240-like n=1 Tax=Rutidosis leptorrhynchoides TaxID=125765 RepID=UPI003A9A634A